MLLVYFNPNSILSSDHLGYAAAQRPISEAFPLMHTGIQHVHSSKRRVEGEAGAGAGCMPSVVHPAHITPLFGVQAVQDIAKSQAER